MPDSTLQDVHRLQKTDIGAGNRLLLRFLREELDLPFAVESVELRPSAVSLNSINGVLQTSAGRKFFKTHIEPASVVGEYYNVKLLQDAGYPIIAPIFASTVYGKQFLIYDWFEAPSLFESIRVVETGARKAARDLLEAAQASDDLLFELYTKSLCTIDAEAHAQQPVHQLFLHRLVGSRYRNFYGGDFVLPDQRMPFAALAAKNWIINGVAYRDTLETLVTQAIDALAFPGIGRIPVVTGHGDAHAGNLFYFGPQEPLTYFDPAFAGTHSPLLDVVKPLIHNSLLKWLYFPEEVAAGNVAYGLTGDTIVVDYDFSPSALRLALFESKLSRVVAPTLKLLKMNGGLAGNWQAVMQAAALCCPLLTMNLADRDRFRPEVALLALAMAVEFGGRGESPERPSWFERRLKEAAPQ